MSKKQLVLSILAAILVIYIIYVYRSHHAAPPKPAAQFGTPKSQTPPVMKPSQPQQTNTQPQPADNQQQDLINSYSAQISAGKDVANSFYQRGLVYQNMHQYRLAVQDYTDALKLEKDSVNALYNRALCYQQERLFDNAIADLTQAITLKSDFAAAYNTRGLVYVEQNNLQDATQDYQQAIKLDPTYDQAYFNLGALYLKQQDYKNAKDAFANAIANNKPAKDASSQDIASSNVRLMQAYLKKATAELFLADLTSALNDANYVITNDANNIDAYRLRSVIYDKMGDTAASAKDNATADDMSMQQMLDHKQ
jgi:tetratricopeptide (TPR) repeat protein